MKAYLIAASHESARSSNIEALKHLSPFPVIDVEAIYPSRSKVPFVQQMLALSKKRAGRPLLMGELGCLMSHRKVWKQLIGELDNETDHALILESDSSIVDPAALQMMKEQAEAGYDLFFWGAWEGHMKMFRSTKQQLDEKYTIGESFIKTVYCTYGYSVNKRAAEILLQRTRKISYPVDQFKKFFTQEELRIGGILPEVITGNTIGSTIRGKENHLIKTVFLALLDLKNTIICFFK